MKILRHLTSIFLSLPITYLFTQWWLNSRWSERTWTWLNQRLGQNFGLASDIELVLTLGCAFALSFTITLFVFFLFQMTFNWQSLKNADLIRQIIRFSLMGFWILFASYFLLWLGNFAGIQGAGVGFWTNLSASLIFVLLLTMLVCLLWHRVQNALTRHSKKTSDFS